MPITLLKTVRLIFVISLFFPAASFAASIIEADIPSYLETGESASWTCKRDPFGPPPSASTQDFCYIDPDGAFKGEGHSSFFGTVSLDWTRQGVYEVATSTRSCSVISNNNCGPLGWRPYRIIVAPKGGWNLSLTGDTTITVGEIARFSAKAQSATDCCDFQWDFGDGSSEEDYQTDGTSQASKRYRTPGLYTIKVMLEDRATDRDLINRSGAVVSKKITLLVKDKPKPPPGPVSSLVAETHIRGAQANGFLPVSLSGSDQAGILWDNRHTDEDNSFNIEWSKPSNAKTKIQYRVDFGDGINGSVDDIGWTDFAVHPASVTKAWLVSLPPSIIDLYWSRAFRVPSEKFDPTSQEYIMVYYRFRSENSNGVSDWRYTPGLWYYYRD